MLSGLKENIILIMIDSGCFNEDERIATVQDTQCFGSIPSFPKKELRDAIQITEVGVSKQFLLMTDRNNPYQKKLLNIMVGKYL